MAMISEFREEEAKPSTFSSPPPKPVSFSASLDTANPVGFLEKVFDFLAKESDFLGKENVDKEIAAVVRIAKEKNMKKVEEVALKVEIKKKEVKEENEIKKGVKRMEVDKKEDKKEEKSSSGLKDDGTFYEKEAVRIERIEKSQEEIRELMALMKDMMAMIVKRKWVAENPSSQERPALQDRREDPLYGYTPSYTQTSQEAYTYMDIPIMAPDRLSLQNLEMKEGESFREYALRWRDVATQVQPPLTKRETTILFWNTLGAPYYEMLIGNAATFNFADMVSSGEMIENAIKSGKLDVGEKNGGTAQENEEETSYPVYSSYPPYYPVNNVAPLTNFY